MYTTRTIAQHLSGSLFFFWLHWEFTDAHRLSLVVASEGSSLCRAQASHCVGLSVAEHGLESIRVSVVVEYELSCPGART